MASSSNDSIPIPGDASGGTFQTERGVFQEGEPAFDRAGVKLKSHIQVAVRNPRAVIGYFRPETP